MTTTATDQVGPSDPDVTYCARHPEVETALRCSRCETLICPRCLIQTPVGARCRDCAQLRKNPIYEVSRAAYLRMGAVAVVGGGLIGALWAFVAPGQFFLGFFSLLISAGVGWLMAKGVERAANYRRGQTVQGFAVFGILIAYLVRSALVYDGLSIDIYGLIALGVACFVAIQQLK